MYEPFLEWLYGQDLSDISNLPALVTFMEEEINDHASLSGDRREGNGLPPNARSWRRPQVDFRRAACCLALRRSQ
jgi:hypothetical protein